MTTIQPIKKMSYAAAMRDYFGFLPGQSVGGFMSELKALTDEDKVWFRENLPKVGYEITNSVQ